MKKIITLFAALCATLLVAAAPHTFQVKGGEFMLDGKPVRIISGEMHYPRIPHQYWRNRLETLRAMGANTVTTYVFWNLHEPRQGQWNFRDDADLARFVKTAGEVGLMVILRPGPYVCAEWEYGGLPWWLQTIDGMEVRSDNEPFLGCTDAYFKRLYKEVGGLLVTKGGPIIMLQTENEFGSFVAQKPETPLAEHQRYSARIKGQIRDAGFSVPLFTSDGSWLFKGGSTPGVLPTANGENDIARLKEQVDKFNGGQGPYMIGEFYPGWLTHWGEGMASVGASGIARQTEKYLRGGVSFNYYMVHGGTNFGFWSGANYSNSHDIQPDITSYDYNAPITEAGWTTPKYDSLRAVIARYVASPLPAVPERIGTMAIPQIKLTTVSNALSYATSSMLSAAPETFEQLGQGYGYVAYYHTFADAAKGELEVRGLRDYATVYVDGAKVGTLDRSNNRYTLSVDIEAGSTLMMLVENMGRINYGAALTENTKGIISPVKINGAEVTGDWIMKPLPFDTQPTSLGAQTIANTGASAMGQPVVYFGEFTLKGTGDTFVDMRGWQKGIVFVNGHNLGRYWSVGPQQTLYLPGVWLHKGVNTIAVFDQSGDAPHTTIATLDTPLLN